MDKKNSGLNRVSAGPTGSLLSQMITYGSGQLAMRGWELCVNAYIVCLATALHAEVARGVVVEQRNPGVVEGGGHALAEVRLAHLHHL